MRRSLAVLALLAFAAHARADDRELYMLLQASPEFFHLTVPAPGKGSATETGFAASAVAYYGLTDTIHVGGAFHYATTSNATFTDASVRLPQGAPSTGDVYADVRSLAVTAVAVYRYDTGRHLAPLLQLEAGFASISYTNVQHVPSGGAYTFGLPDTTDTTLDLRASLRLEYRFFEHFVVAAGPGVVLHPGAHNPWAVLFPISIGYIW